MTVLAPWGLPLPTPAPAAPAAPIEPVLTFLATPAAVAWLRHEWFQSTLDEAALGVNDGQRLLQSHGLPADTSALTPRQWAYLRAALPRPRRFSARFLQQEREQLELRRAKIRSMQRSGGLVRA